MLEFTMFNNRLTPLPRAQLLRVPLAKHLVSKNCLDARPPPLAGELAPPRRNCEVVATVLTTHPGTGVMTLTAHGEEQGTHAPPGAAAKL